MHDSPMDRLRARNAARIAAGELTPIVEHAVRETTYGTVTTNEHGTTVRGSAYELADWARRPGAVWPCSILARLDELTASFDARGDLVDLIGDDGHDIPADELNAWTSDVLRDAGLHEHPAIR